MASVLERRDSGSGNHAGMRGQAASRLFDVQLTEGDIDSVSGLADDIEDPLTPVAVRFPIGTPHPTAGFRDLVVFHWFVARRNPRRMDRYIVRVEYNVPLVAIGGGVSAWTITRDTGFETVEMPIDLDGKTIGGHAYRVAGEDAAGNPEQHTHTAKTLTGTVNLIQIPDVVDPKPQTLDVPMRNIRCTNRVPYLTQQQSDRADVFTGKTNSRHFMGEPPGTVLAGPLKYTRRPGQIEGSRQPTPGVVYDLELNFLAKNRLWSPFRLFDRWEQRGFESQVLDLNAEPVFTDFKKNESANLYGMLSLFGVLDITDKVPKGLR